MDFNGRQREFVRAKIQGLAELIKDSDADRFLRNPTEFFENIK